MSNDIQQQSILGSLATLAKVAANTGTNILLTIDNTASAAERLTHVAKSKATNIAEISMVTDSMKMLEVRKELKDKMDEMGASYKDGVLSFD